MSSKEKLYICYEPDYEGNVETIKSEEEWKKDFDKYGDKSNFSDRDSWFGEMLMMQILILLVEE